MNCRKIQQNMSDRLTNSLSEAEQQQMDKHLDSCPACKILWAEECRLWGDLGKYPEPPQVHADFTAQVLNKARAAVLVDEAEQKIIEFPVRKTRWKPAVAAAAALAFIAGGYLFTLNGNEPSRMAEIESPGVSDEMIIANLDILEDLELLENLEFFEDLDVIENLAMN